MAKLGEEHVYSSIEISKYFKIPITCHEEFHFVNAGKTVIKIHDQKPLHTWTVKHPHYFSCPIIYFDEYLFCLINGNTLIKWSVHDDNLDQAENSMLKEPAFSVLHISPEHIFILNNSGKLAVIDTKSLLFIKTLGSDVINSFQDLLWSYSFVQEQNLIINFLLCNKESKEYTLYAYTIENENNIVNLRTQNIQQEESDLKNWTCNKNYFLTLWSDGKICRYDLSTTDISDLLKVADVYDFVAVDCIDCTHIALAKYMGKKEIVIEVWDTKFSVLKARKMLKCSNIDHLQISVMNSNIFLCYNKSLVSIPFVVEQSTLAAAVGKSVSQPEPTHEFSWGVEGGLVELAKYRDSEMVVDVPENTPESIQIIVQRLLQQKSKLKYLPESELIRLLKMAVRYKSKFKKNEKLNSKESDIIFNFVFSSSFSDVFLIKYLKHISLEETLLILKLMLLYLNNKFEHPPDVLRKPTDLQILNWTHLVIQSHIDSLLLLKDKKSMKLLRKLNKAVAQKMEEYETAAGIQSYFFLLNKKIVPEKSAVSRYCTETLDV